MKTVPVIDLTSNDGSVKYISKMNIEVSPYDDAEKRLKELHVWWNKVKDDWSKWAYWTGGDNEV